MGGSSSFLSSFFNARPHSPCCLLRRYKELNTLEFSDQDKAAIVDEANVVFRLNIEVFDELEGSAAGAFWSFAYSSFLDRLKESNPVIRGMIV